MAKQFVFLGAELQSRSLLAKLLHCLFHAQTVPKSEGHNEGALSPTFSKVRSREKICADHLQAIPPRLVGSEHQADSLKGLLDHW
jgi:hypothetical protein